MQGKRTIENGATRSEGIKGPVIAAVIIIVLGLILLGFIFIEMERDGALLPANIDVRYRDVLPHDNKSEITAIEVRYTNGKTISYKPTESSFMKLGIYLENYPHIENGDLQSIIGRISTGLMDIKKENMWRRIN